MQKHALDQRAQNFCRRGPFGRRMVKGRFQPLNHAPVPVGQTGMKFDDSTFGAGRLAFLEKARLLRFQLHQLLPERGRCCTVGNCLDDPVDLPLDIGDGPLNAASLASFLRLTLRYRLPVFLRESGEEFGRQKPFLDAGENSSFQHFTQDRAVVLAGSFLAVRHAG